MNTVFAGTNYEQSIFSLEFNIYGTGVEIRLNDIPVYYHDAQGQVSSQKPIPESIIDGENVLTIKSFPLEEDGCEYQPGAYVEAVISVRKKNAPLNDAKTLLQLKLNPTNPKENLLDNTLAKLGNSARVILEGCDKQVVAERRIHINSPFPRWAWQNGQAIDNTPDNFDTLLTIYKEIWSALDSGDKGKVRELYDFAAQEFAWAYHYQDKKHGHRIMNTGGLIGDEDWKLGSMSKFLEKFDYHLDIFSNGKMARILDQKNRSPIVYLSRRAKIINIQKFVFYKNKAGEWVMIR